MSTLFTNETADIHWHADTRTLHVEWKSFMPSPSFRETMNKGLELVRSHSARVWIADTRAVTSPMTKEDQALVGEMGAQFVDAGLQATVTVVPGSMIAKLANRGWQKRVGGDDGGLVMTEVGSLDEAFEVAQAVKQAA